MRGGAYALRLVALLLCMTLCGHRAAAQLLHDDGSDDTDTLVRSWREALPRKLVGELIKDSTVQAVQAQSGMKFGKMSTFFLRLAGKGRVKTPRFATERAIFRLKDLAMSQNAFKGAKVVGAEWWYQARDTTENIGFHYDKDEGIASNEMRMVYPQISTVTYLTNTGAPTMVLNMTTPRGNGNTPVVADNGYLSFPQANKHFIFSGRLMHGVLGSLTKVGKKNAGRRGKRITLLINWWTSAPKPPNCVEVTDAQIAEYATATPTKTELDQADAVRAEPTVIEEVPVDDDASSQHEIRLPPDEPQLLQFPDTLKDPDTVYLNWGQQQTLGGVGVLDLFNDQSVSAVFNTQEPKLLYFHSTTKEKARAALLPLARPVVNPGPTQMHPFVAGWKESSDAWEHFGVQKDEVPRLAIHDTAKEKMYTMRTPPTPENVASFIYSFWAGTLTPNGEQSKGGEAGDDARDEL